MICKPEIHKVHFRFPDKNTSNGNRTHDHLVIKNTFLFSNQMIYYYLCSNSFTSITLLKLW